MIKGSRSGVSLLRKLSFSSCAMIRLWKLTMILENKFANGHVLDEDRTCISAS